MRTIEPSDLAYDDLGEIIDYLETYSLPAAARFRASYEEILRLLIGQPKIGRPRDDLKPGIRTRVLGDYVLLYTFDDSTVRIYRVLHGARDIERIVRDGE